MSKKNQQQVQTLKVIIIGDSGVGKTNLITTFCEGKFKENYVATIGVDFKIKNLNIDGYKIKLQIWDTAGQQRFRTISQAYYKGAAGIFLTYAINSASSFKNISKWLKQIQSHATENVCKMLVATKSDLEKQRQVTYQKGKNLADNYGIAFEEVSAKNGINVTEIFIQMAKVIKKQRGGFDSNPNETNGSVNLIDGKIVGKKNCGC